MISEYAIWAQGGIAGMRYRMCFVTTPSAELLHPGGGEPMAW